MKSIVILYDDIGSKYAEEKVFGGNSAAELCKKAAESIVNDSDIVESVVTISSASSLTQLLEEIQKKARENNADFVIFSYSDLPFLNKKLTEELVQTHVEYKAEYTFSDGYPYGFAPEIIDTGCLSILLGLCRTTQQELGNGNITRESIFNLIKTDINSFEVETVLADNDYRLLRFAFHCGFKGSRMQCEGLYNKIKPEDLLEKNADELSAIAAQSIECLKTVPSFYEIQISQKVSSSSLYSPYCSEFKRKFGTSPVEHEKYMTFDMFSSLVEKIADFSEEAVISLSLWGECFYNPELLKMIEKVLSYDGLSVFLETDGLNITDDFIENLKNLVKHSKKRTNGWAPVNIAVQIDAFTSETYRCIKPESQPGDFEKSVSAVEKLNLALPGCVYPQFTRMNQNEAELENFFRYWNEKTNPSGGKLVIQKYNDYSGVLGNFKPADLSPVERGICWHLRRDMTILLNGDVTSCKCCVLDNILGNITNQSLQDLWHKNDELLNNHLGHKFNKLCEKCDEYYTFNF